MGFLFGVVDRRQGNAAVYLLWSSSRTEEERIEDYTTVLQAEPETLQWLVHLT